MTLVVPLLYSHQETEIGLEKEPLVLCLASKDVCLSSGSAGISAEQLALGEITCSYLDVVNQSAFIIYHPLCKNNA